MKKRIITLILAAVLCLTACGSEESDDYSDEYDTTEEAAGGSYETEGLELGAGFEAGEVTAQLDEHPDRAIRRSTRPIVQTVGTMLDGTPLPGDFYLYRNTLNDHGKQVYDLIRSSLAEGKTEIPMTISITPEDAVMVFNMVIYDNPEFFWAHTSLNYEYNNYNCVTVIRPDYNDLVTDIPGCTAQMEAALSDALADMWSLDSTAAQVKYAHDYLTYMLDYVPGSSYNQSMYSAAVLNETVCAGYAKAFQYMMHRMGISCALVVGEGGQEAHGWNIVQVGTDYYAMDVTWDDPIGNAPDQYYYNYYNITDDQLSRNHTRWDISAALPWATGTAFGFHESLDTYGTDFDAIKGYLPEAYDDYEAPADDGGSWSDSGENAYLPSGGGNAYIADEDAQDFDWDEWSYDDYSDFGYDWWNALDESWTPEDWYDYGDGTWEIWDEETQCYYFYDESDGTFGCMDANDETFYLLDFETGEWIPLN